MRKSFLLAGLSFSVATLMWGQTAPAPAADPTATVAVVNGRSLTRGDIAKMIAATPAQVQAAFRNNPSQFMKEYAWYKYLESLAEKGGMDKTSPYKEILEFRRLMTLYQAVVNNAAGAVSVTRDDEKAYYDANRDRYREVQAKLIYLPFTPAQANSPAAPKGQSEGEVKAKAADIAKQAKSGTDFVKLVKEHSEDLASAKQNGDIGTPVRSTTTSIPEPLRKVVLAMKPGDISDPVRAENGYYVFKAVSADVLPYEKIREEIFEELRQAGLRKWVEKTQAESQLKIANEDVLRQIAAEIQQQPAQ